MCETNLTALLLTNFAVSDSLASYYCVLGLWKYRKQAVVVYHPDRGFGSFADKHDKTIS